MPARHRVRCTHGGGEHVKARILSIDPEHPDEQALLDSLDRLLNPQPTAT